MKKMFLFRAVGIMLIAFSLISCSKKNMPVPENVNITSIIPNIARGGDTIKILGNNLLKDIANTHVLLNGKQAVIAQATKDSIKAIVPALAGSGPVLLKVDNEQYQGPSFTYDYKVIVTTIAGTGIVGNSDGEGLASSFYCPWGIAANAAGDLFVADCYNRLIRKISASDHSVSTYTIPTLVNGNRFYSPYNLAIDTTTQNVYVTDFNEHLMKMDPSGNMDVIYIDSMPLTGIAVNPSHTNLFISNNTKGTIVRTDMNGQNPVLFTTGLITPRNIIYNQKGEMFVAAYPGPVYKINNEGTSSDVGYGADFNGWEIATDTSGNFFLADHFNNCLRMIDKNGNSKIIAGSGQAADIDGIGLQASFDGPQGIAIDTKGILYVTTYNYDKQTGNRVRKIVLE